MVTLDETYHSFVNIADAQDKKKGALIVAQGFGYTDPEMKNLSYVNTMNLFIRGIGGFESQPKKYKNYISIPKIPKRSPDVVLKVYLIRKSLGKIRPFYIDYQGMITHFILIQKWRKWGILISPFCMDYAFMAFVPRIFSDILGIIWPPISKKSVLDLPPLFSQGKLSLLM